VRADEAAGFEEDGSASGVLVYDNNGVNDPRLRQPWSVLEVDGFGGEVARDVLRKVIPSKTGCVGAAGADARRGHQGGRRQPAAPARASRYTDLSFRRRVRRHIKDIINGGNAKSEDIETFHASPFHRCPPEAS
jgi:hypothetical protein